MADDKMIKSIGQNAIKSNRDDNSRLENEDFESLLLVLIWLINSNTTSTHLGLFHA